MTLENKKLYINGEWVETADAYEDINPATEEVICSVAKAGTAEVDAAVGAARAAFESGKWSTMAPKKRGQILWKIGELIRTRIEEFAALETADNGKPIFESLYVDMPAVADCFQYYAGWATKIHGETIPIGPNSLNYTLREPVGVVAAIVPWNFPLLLTSWKVAPALSAGNTVVLKPATNTPLTALLLAEVAQEAGLPPGALNVITGPGSVIGQALVEHSQVDKISFTGETATGQQILRSSADTLKRVTLELGGKSPNIILADADVDAAIKGAAMGIFYGKGEVCAAGSRLLVEDKIHDEVVEKLAARTKKLVPADPMHPKTKLGALVSEGQMNKVLGYIEAGTSGGAELVAGGNRADIGTGKGYFVEPTIFDNVTNDMKIAQEEIFGPVLSTITFSDPEQAVAIANDTPYGLAAAVWSRDIKRAHIVARRLKAGTVWINTYNNYDAASPFGGYKMSGFGRELGAHALESYTEVKNVWVDLNE